MKVSFLFDLLTISEQADILRYKIPMQSVALHRNIEYHLSRLYYLDNLV
jgi:hypothetical protein